MKTFLAFLGSLGTDSKDRPEVKAILGIAVIVISIVWLFLKSDVTGFLLIFAAGAALLGIKTAEDIKLDSQSKGQ